MSHFSLLVITKTKPSETRLAEILQPWHEFECTGVDDQYVVDVDKTDEMRKGYETDTVRRLKDPDGVYHVPYDDRFHREPTADEVQKIGPIAGTGCGHGLVWSSKDWGDGRGYRTKIRFIPDGFVEVEVPHKEIMTFREYVADQTDKEKEVVQIGRGPLRLDPKKHKYGYTVIDEEGEVLQVIDRTNPNAKWDWWQIGGRYTGKFAANYDPNADPRNIETCWLCRGTGKRNDALGIEARAKNPTYTCNGCNGRGKSAKWPTQRAKVESDQIQVRDIPLEALRTEEEVKAAKTYDAFTRIVAGRPVPNWEEIRERNKDDMQAARNEYHNNPVVRDLNASEEFKNCWDLDLESFAVSREKYLARARASAVSAFAIVKDGEWYERGRMGWWGCVHDEKDEEEWRAKTNELFDSLAPSDWITVVDCHI